jgi:nucleoside-diphosphate-sugar epimerase
MEDWRAMQSPVNPIIDEDLVTVLNSPVAWSHFSGKTVLITGAYGMLLSYMTWAFLRMNRTNPGPRVTIIALVRDLAKAKTRFAKFLGQGDLVLVEHDLSSKIDVSGPIDYIIHGASYASPHTFGLNPSAVLIPNVMGTYHLLELAKAHKVESFLYFSSGAVYGRPLIGEEVTEEYFGYLDPLDVRNCYGESKRMAENMCRCWHQQFGVPVKIVRPAHMYGPTMDIENDSRVFASFVRNVVRGDPITMSSDGSAKRSFCYISDATTAFFKVLLEGADGNAYNVGNDECYVSIRQLAETFTSVCPGSELIVRGAGVQKKGAEEQMFMASAKIHELGWTCTVPLAAGIRRTIESYK